MQRVAEIELAKVIFPAAFIKNKVSIEFYAGPVLYFVTNIIQVYTSASIIIHFLFVGIIPIFVNLYFSYHKYTHIYTCISLYRCLFLYKVNRSLKTSGA